MSIQNIVADLAQIVPSEAQAVLVALNSANPDWGGLIHQMYLAEHSARGNNSAVGSAAAALRYLLAIAAFENGARAPVNGFMSAPSLDTVLALGADAFGYWPCYTRGAQAMDHGERRAFLSRHA